MLSNPYSELRVTLDMRSVPQEGLRHIHQQSRALLLPHHSLIRKKNKRKNWEAEGTNQKFGVNIHTLLIYKTESQVRGSRWKRNWHSSQPAMTTLACPTGPHLALALALLSRWQPLMCPRKSPDPCRAPAPVLQSKPLGVWSPHKNTPAQGHASKAGRGNCAA